MELNENPERGDERGDERGEEGASDGEPRVRVDGRMTTERADGLLVTDLKIEEKGLRTLEEEEKLHGRGVSAKRTENPHTARASAGQRPLVCTRHSPFRIGAVQARYHLQPNICSAMVPLKAKPTLTPLIGSRTIGVQPQGVFLF